MRNRGYTAPEYATRGELSEKADLQLRSPHPRDHRLQEERRSHVTIGNAVPSRISMFVYPYNRIRYVRLGWNTCLDILLL